MDCGQRFDCLDFNNDTALYEHVRPVTDIETVTVVLNREFDLSLNPETSLSEFECKARLIGAF